MLTKLCLYATETTVKQIEDAFKEFTAREDIAIVLISQYVSNLFNAVVSFVSWDHELNILPQSSGE